MASRGWRQGVLLVTRLLGKGRADGTLLLRGCPVYELVSCQPPGRHSGLRLLAAASPLA